MNLPAAGFGAALCAVCALLLCPRAAHAQGADSLPTLDETSAPVVIEPPAPPPETPVVVVQSPSKKAPMALGPIRAQRRLALLGEAGWNGLAGFGPNLVFHVDPHFSLDLGVGLSAMGWKVGMRGRYNLLTGPVTPFIGVGILGGGGVHDLGTPINKDDPDPTREKVNVKILPSAWLQTVAGVDWTSKNGFTMLGMLGYARLLSHDPVQVTSGQPNEDERRAFDFVWRSGPVISIAIGKSFQ
jgi:hypothetical protein